jgi:hypothetical protein
MGTLMSVCRVIIAPFEVTLKNCTTSRTYLRAEVITCACTPRVRTSTPSDMPQLDSPLPPLRLRPQDLLPFAWSFWSLFNPPELHNGLASSNFPRPGFAPSGLPCHGDSPDRTLYITLRLVLNSGTERHGLVVKTAALYSGGPDIKSRPERPAILIEDFRCSSPSVQANVGIEP